MAGDIGASMDGGWRQCASMDGESETVAATSLGAVGRRSRCREVPEEDEAGAEKFQSQIWNTTGRESEFDQVVSDGPAVIMWTASWCRKCIYLKPKVEKLAAEFLHRVRFYCVDVNKVPHKLVARAAVTKMPTVQLWRDGKKQNELIGGDKAHLVVNQVRQMIDNDSEI